MGQEILEMVEATHPRIGSGVVGSGEVQGADCIVGMSTRPELTTGVTSRQSTCEEGATEHLHTSRIYNPQSRLSDLECVILASKVYLISAQRAECHHRSHADE